MNLDKMFAMAGLQKDNTKWYVLGAIVLLVVCWYFKDVIKGWFVKVNKLSYDPNLATISQAQANNYAEVLFNAMKGVGTDDKAVENVRLMLQGNYADLAMVYNAFGKRDYGTYGSPLWGSGTLSDLRDWIKRELSGSKHDSWMTMFAALGI